MPSSVSAGPIRNPVSLPAWLAVLGLVTAILPSVAFAAEAPGPPAEALGTLFYTVAERNAIVRARQGQGNIGATPEAGAATAPSNPLMTINGVVKRKNGNSTVWINGQAVQEGQSLAPTTRTSISASGATLDDKQIKVGETVELNTDARTDIVSPGAVRRK